jgi:hypothetical protein
MVGIPEQAAADNAAGKRVWLPDATTTVIGGKKP